MLASIGEAAPIFHWHLDTYTLPPGAVHLAVSEQTPMQAFRVGRASYGIQFHFEADRPLLREWNVAFSDYIAERHPDWEIVALDKLLRRGSELNLPRLNAAGVRFVHGHAQPGGPAVAAEARRAG